MTDWSLANCQGLNPDWFFPPAGREGLPLVAQAKAVCAGCEIRQACLQHALDHHEIHGVWGGLDASERRTHRRRPRIAEHGTRARYQGGCRCQDCRGANAYYIRRGRVS